MSTREVRSRSLDRMLGQFLGGKFRFACAALMLLASGMWIQSNQKGLEGNWQSLKNTTFDSKGLENVKEAISAATEQAKTATINSEPKQWKSVWGGLINERNVLFVAIAGMLVLGSVLGYGWKISFVVVPVAVLLCIVPRLM